MPQDSDIQFRRNRRNATSGDKNNPSVIAGTDLTPSRSTLPISSPPGIHLSNIWFTLKTRPLTIIACTLICGFIGLITATLLPDRYTAVTLISLTRDNFPSATLHSPDGEVEIIKSGAVAAKVAERLNLMADSQWLQPTQDHFADFRNWLNKRLGFTPTQQGTSPIAQTPQAQRLSRAIRKLQSIVKVRRVGLSDVITIEATASTPYRAAELPNTYADIYLEQQLEAKIEPLKKAELVLGALVRKYDAELAKAESQLHIRDLYNDSLTKLEATAQARLMTTPHARVASRASAPSVPAFPPRKTILALSVIVGMGIGFTLAYILSVPTRAFNAQRSI